MANHLHDTNLRRAYPFSRGTRRWVAAAALLVLAGCSGTDVTDPPPEPIEPGPKWRAFHIDELKTQRENQRISFLEFLSGGALTAGLYHLNEGEVDSQEPHSLDEVYYILNGAAVLDIDGTKYEVAAGSVYK